MMKIEQYNQFLEHRINFHLGSRSEENDPVAGAIKDIANMSEKQYRTWKAELER